MSDHTERRPSMNREWKPGDVGVSGGGERFIVTAKGECFWPGETGGYWAGVSGRPNEIDRPLVVIDPEDAEQVERLAGFLADIFCAEPERGWAEQVQAALREFANPTPRIEEPKGLGAVVEDDKGKRWVRCNPSGAAQWLIEDAGALVRIKHQTWFDLNAVRVLSPGVEGAPS